MSNFLERIAATARPAESVGRSRLQPMLGSIYAPSASLTASTEIPTSSPGAWEQSAETVAQSSPSTKKDSRAERLFPFLPEQELRTSPALPRHTSVLPGEDGTERGNASAFGRSQGKDSEQYQRPAAKKSARDTLQNNEFAQAATTGNPAHQSAATKNKEASYSPSEPLLPLQSLRTTPHQLADTLRRAQVQHSEPDEIHIHIGRIEVAAAPPVPRPAAAAPRSGVNLDEYLRRNRGGLR